MKLERIAAWFAIVFHGIGSSNAFCHTWKYVVKRYGFNVSKKSIWMFEIMMNAIITAMVPMIGPIAFSTNEENRNASDATHHMLKVARENAKAILNNASDLGSMVRVLPGTSRSPAPNSTTPRAMLRPIKKKTSVKV